MPQDWSKLTRHTDGRAVTIERVRTDEGVAIEGDFGLPPLAALDGSDQSFVIAFVHCHGSIKQMERWFGVSYPTIKARLNRIAGQLEFAEIVDNPEPPSSAIDVLERLERGEVSADDAIEELER